MRHILVAMLAIFSLVHIAQAKEPNGLRLDNVEGTTPGVGTFDGSILIDKIVPEGRSTNSVRVVGTIIRGSVVNALGNANDFVNEPFSAPTTLATQGACGVLFLDIGPVELNVLGLVVDVFEIEVDNDSLQGGEMLFDRLCLLPGLLAAGKPVGDSLFHINNLLNRELAVLSP